MNWSCILSLIIVFFSIDYFLNRLNITTVNRFLKNSVAVTLQWPREAGEVYNINNISPVTEFTNETSHDSSVINLIISYNIQLNISIVSNLCDVTTTMILKYGES